jgi:hypothetical protein
MWQNDIPDIGVHETAVLITYSGIGFTMTDYPEMIFIITERWIHIQFGRAIGS